jgi:hypothetical protein
MAVMSTLREELDAEERECEEPSIFGMLEGTSLENQKRAWRALGEWALAKKAKAAEQSEKDRLARVADRTSRGEFPDLRDNSMSASLEEADEILAKAKNTRAHHSKLLSNSNTDGTSRK